MDKTDIFISGGGPGGLAAAIAARQRGLSVAVADASDPPIDKACGEGLMPDAIAALLRWGISIQPDQGYLLRGIAFINRDRRVEASFPDRPGLGIRRTVLHRLLTERALASGVSLLWRTPVTGLDVEGVHSGAKAFPARWIIAADGGNSRARRWAGLDDVREENRFAFRRHYRIPPWSDHVEVYWGRKSQAYVTPISKDEICVAVASREPGNRLTEALEDFPQIAARLQTATCSSKERGAVSSTRRVRHVHSGRVILVGDASGSVDCITGEGLGLAFHQADALADCLAQEDLSAYGGRHAAICRRTRLMSQFLLALDRKEWLRDRAMRAFESHHGLFARMLALHVGALSATECATTGIMLGWRLLSA